MKYILHLHRKLKYAGLKYYHLQIWYERKSIISCKYGTKEKVLLVVNMGRDLFESDKFILLTETLPHPPGSSRSRVVAAAGQQRHPCTMDWLAV